MKALNIFFVLTLSLPGVSFATADMTYQEAKAFYENGTSLRHEDLPTLGVARFRVIEPNNKSGFQHNYFWHENGEVRVANASHAGDDVPEVEAWNFTDCKSFVPPAVLDEARTKSLYAYALYKDHRFVRLTPEGKMAGWIPYTSTLWRNTKDKNGKNLVIGRLDVVEPGFSFVGREPVEPISVVGRFYFVADKITEVSISDDVRKEAPNCRKFWSLDVPHKVGLGGTPIPE